MPLKENTQPSSFLQRMSYLRNTEHFNKRNNQRRIFNVTAFEHKDNVWPELRTKTELNLYRPFIANQWGHGIYVCDILSVCKIAWLAIVFRIVLRLL